MGVAMKWSPQQDNALMAVQHWLRTGDKQVFRLFGYAGTGKTTLARHLAEGTNGRVIFAAYTGKAALMMRKFGCKGARTIHNLIYDFQQKLEDGTLVFDHKWDSDADGARLIIIDECSMVDAEIGHDLLRFRVPVLVLGDPAQLPPIDGGGFFTEATPDVMLTEIHRQAADNPIIAMATAVRSGKPLMAGRYGESLVSESHANIDPLDFDQVLVGRNRTRQIINGGVRSRLRLYGMYPRATDKLVCLRNDYDVGLLNGEIWFVEEVMTTDSKAIRLQIRPEEGGESRWVTTHKACFDGQAEDLDGYAQFDYGYALTVHKAQGSQWDNVLLHDQSHSFKEHWWRWLYTGLTRASKRVTVVM
jgi:exodeoxyribonuclease-5